jgi:hypothetical protein
VDEINESITHIALSFEIHREIEVIILAFVIGIDHLKELHLLELIRNISDHDGCPFFLLSHYLIEINIIPLSIKAFFFFLRGLSFKL